MIRRDISYLILKNLNLLQVYKYLHFTVFIIFLFYFYNYEICFYSCLLSYYMLINVDYTITYFLPIPSTVPRTRARSELLNVSLVPPRVEFYTALPVSIVGRY